MRLHVITIPLLLASLALTGCSRSSSTPRANAAPDAGTGMAPGSPPTAPVVLDRRCDDAVYPSPAWLQCERENASKTLEAPLEQLTQPAFLAQAGTQSGVNVGSYLTRALQDPSWLLLSLNGLSDPVRLLARGLPGLLALNGNTPVTSLTSTFAGPAVSDPFRFPEAPGPDGAAFYRDEAVVTPVVFYDRDCTRQSGRIWQPRQVTGQTPGIVINNGSVQAHEPAYWWAAQALVRAGYQVMTYDPRGQGRSDFLGPQGQPGTNLEPRVFWLGLVDAIDFFRSSPDRPAPHQARCAATFPTETTRFNPAHAALDRERLGLAGHSLGAIGVSVVQGYGAPGAAPWPGKLDTENPVDVIVAWDGLLRPGGGLVGGAFQGGGLGDLLDRLGLTDPLFRVVVERGLPDFGIRVPAMSQGSDYGLLVAPFLAPPDPQQRLRLGFDAWQQAGKPVYDVTIRGSTHLEWSLLVGLPTTSWCASTAGNRCSGGWGMPTAQHYTVAWFDRWLKQAGEAGFADAEARLLDSRGPFGRDRLSFRYRSAHDFPLRDGQRSLCLDKRSGC